MPLAHVAMNGAFFPMEKGHRERVLGLGGCRSVYYNVEQSWLVYPLRYENHHRSTFTTSTTVYRGLFTWAGKGSFWPPVSIEA